MDLTKLKEHQKSKKIFEIEYKNVGELFFHQTKKNHNQVFVIFPGIETNVFTYNEFEELVLKTCKFLEINSINQGDTISIIFLNSPEFLLIYFASLILGITIVPINPDISSGEIKFIINNSLSKKIIYDEKFESKILEIAQKNNEQSYLKISSLNQFNEYEKINQIPQNVVLNDLAVIIYTSGTSGNPKGVKLSHLNLLADAKSISEWFQFNSKTRTLCILPLFHNNGQITTLLAPLYQGGSAIIVKGKMSLISFWEIVKKFDATWTSVMASILSILLSLPKNRKDNTLNAILCGGQVLTRTVQNDFESRFHIPIFEGYGLTETTSFSCINDFPEDYRKIGSIGKPLPCNEMEILDQNDTIMDFNTEGEICIRGFNVADEYLGLEIKNKESFRNGWFHSGDYGTKDKNGYFYINGRKDSLIIKGGENIYPAEVENILYQNEFVDECAVVGIPDKLLGEEICAFIKIKEGNYSKNDLMEFCREKIAGFKCPKKIIIINELNDLTEIPKGPTKKILYKKLKEYYSKNF